MSFSNPHPRTVTAIALTSILLAGAAGAAVTVTTEPYGVMAEPVSRGVRGLALPLIDGNRYVGLVAGNDGTQLHLSAASADPRPAVEDVGPAYVEVLSGPWEGERFDVDVAATLAGDGRSLALALGAGTHGTRATVAADRLAGARIAVRPHVTLARLQGMFTPALAGSNSPGRADAVELFDGRHFDRYYLRGDGETWARLGRNGDFRDLVIPPDTSILLHTRDGGRTWRHVGHVRTNAFRKNLVAGEQAYATGFPVDLSPIQVGAFVDPATPAEYRWRGARLFPFADWFEERGVGVPLLHRYFLQPDGTAWRRVLDLRNVADDPILAATGMFVLRRNNPDPDYVIPVPFGE